MDELRTTISIIITDISPMTMQAVSKKHASAVLGYNMQHASAQFHNFL
jgi:hypothetical protein